MGRASRRKKQKHVSNSPYPRSGEEVLNVFGDRLDAISERMQAGYLAKGGHSFDRTREEKIESGEIVVNDDGSETHAMSPEMVDLMRLQNEMFEFKFGRKMKGDDPIFFDINADVPQADENTGDETIAMLRVAAKEVGADPDAIVEHFMGQDELGDYKKRVH